MVKPATQAAPSMTQTRPLMRGSEMEPPFPYRTWTSDAFVKLKLSSTPIEMTSHRTENGTHAASMLSSAPTMMVPRRYTPRVLLRNTEGNNPSSDIAAVSSGCGRMLRSTTKGSNANSATLTSHLAHCQPCCPNACGKAMLVIDSVHGTIAASANCAVPDRIAAPSKVPASALGMVFAGSFAFEAMQQTSSKPMKPKNKTDVADTMPAAPVGANVAADWNMLPVHSERPAMMRKSTVQILAAVKVLMTNLPMSVPRATTTAHKAVMAPASGSK
mmetsp:Transcript_2158/g.6434  ORF Transcript_2158/g.6434 Transcript_2158/m.6434 type:complete len:273 (+) Transcript_2158:831-1649(+)